MSKKYTLTDLQQMALARDGECLSTEYKSVKEKYTWRCAEKHVWHASADSVINGKHWCPACAASNRPTKYTIEDMQALAAARSGNCLSTGPVRTQKKLHWQCEFKHQWWQKPSHILAGVWCPVCKGIAPHDIPYLIEQVKGRCIVLLDTQYKGMQARYRWSCEVCSKRWKNTANNVVRGSGCPQCAGKGLGIDTLLDIARINKLTLLDDTYRGSAFAYRFLCQNGHVFGRRLTSIRQDCRLACETCSKYHSESFCRQILETYFKVDLPKKRPAWLMSDSGTRLELDGYNADAAIAFEYQGLQHFQIDGHFNRTTKDLAARSKSDDQKARLCQEQGVTLVIIPTIPYGTSESEFVALVLASIPPGRRSRRADKAIANCKGFAIGSCMLEKMHEKAAQMGGKCLATSFPGLAGSFRWECAVGHQWTARVANVMRGTWCKLCAHNRPGSVQGCQEMAAKKGGKYLSTDYTGALRKAWWQCELGHTWQARPANIKQGRWCHECGRHRTR